ncbi:hypothetical protein H0H81_003854, partial [Sphagnurus paluster]
MPFVNQHIGLDNEYCQYSQSEDAIYNWVAAPPQGTIHEAHIASSSSARPLPHPSPYYGAPVARENHTYSDAPPAQGTVYATYDQIHGYPAPASHAPFVSDSLNHPPPPPSTSNYMPLVAGEYTYPYVSPAPPQGPDYGTSAWDRPYSNVSQPAPPQGAMYHVPVAGSSALPPSNSSHVPLVAQAYGYSNAPPAPPQGPAYGTSAWDRQHGDIASSSSARPLPRPSPYCVPPAAQEYSTYSNASFAPPHLDPRYVDPIPQAPASSSATPLSSASYRHPAPRAQGIPPSTIPRDRDHSLPPFSSAVPEAASDQRFIPTIEAWRNMPRPAAPIQTPAILAPLSAENLLLPAAVIDAGEQTLPSASHRRRSQRYPGPGRNSRTTSPSTVARRGTWRSQRKAEGRGLRLRLSTFRNGSLVNIQGRPRGSGNTTLGEPLVDLAPREEVWDGNVQASGSGDALIGAPIFYHHPTLESNNPRVSLTILHVLAGKGSGSDHNTPPWLLSSMADIDRLRNSRDERVEQTYSEEAIESQTSHIFQQTTHQGRMGEEIARQSRIVEDHVAGNRIPLLENITPYQVRGGWRADRANNETAQPPDAFTPVTLQGLQTHTSGRAGMMDPRILTVYENSVGQSQSLLQEFVVDSLVNQVVL